MAATLRWSVCNCMLLGIILVVRAQNDTTSTTTTTQATTQAATTATQTTTPAPTQGVTQNTDLAACTCNLIAGGCDVNCCCDPDCTNDDRLAFSQCNDEYLAANSQTCVQSSVIFRTNIPYQVNTTVPGLFCIQTDNYNQRNYYNVPELIANETTFDSYKNTYGSYSFQPVASNETLRSTYYKSGETIYTVYESEAIGVLGLPAPMASTQCTDTNPAAYLTPQSLECVRPITNLAQACEVNPMLNAQTYYNGFRVITTPEVFALYTSDNGTTSDTTTPSFSNDTITTPDSGLYNSSYAIDIVPTGVYTCIGIDGLNKTCDFTDVPSPTYELDSTSGNYYCMNTLIQTKYSIETNGTGGILAASVSFVFQDIGDASIPINQIFKSEFTTVDQNVSFIRSGNPGYLVGQPILAGLLQEQLQADGITTLYSIQLDQDRTNWLTMVTSGVNGQCIDDPNQRVSVTFGENMRSGCFVSVDFANMSSYCNLINQAAWTALQGANPPDYVATFGNSDPETVGDWVPINGPDPPGLQASTPDTTQPGVCKNVLVGMTIEVMYANVGALGLPQPQVIGASFQYTYQTEVRFQCFGPYCQPGNGNLQQKLEIVSAVNFIDASSPPQGVSAQRPKITASLPPNFFYPFS